MYIVDFSCLLPNHRIVCITLSSANYTAHRLMHKTAETTDGPQSTWNCNWLFFVYFFKWWSFTCMQPKAI